MANEDLTSEQRLEKKRQQLLKVGVCGVVWCGVVLLWFWRQVRLNSGVDSVDWMAFLLTRLPVMNSVQDRHVSVPFVLIFESLIGFVDI